MARKKTNANEPELSRLIPLPQAAKLADVSEPWLRRLIAAGKVIGVKIGRNYVVDLQSAKSFTRHPFLGRPRKAGRKRGGGAGGGTGGGDQ